VRWVKFAIYATLTVLGIAIVYHRIAPTLRAGVEGVADAVPLAVWGAAGLYLAFYSFVLAAEAAHDRRHRLTFDIAAFVVFCCVFAGRLLGL